MLSQDAHKPDLSISEKLTLATLVLLTISSVFGGPLGLLGRGERHILLAVLVLTSLVELWRGDFAAAGRFIRCHPVVLAPGLFGAVNLLWVFRAVFQNPGKLSLAILDAQSMLVPLLTTLVFVAHRQRAYLLLGWAKLTVLMVAALGGIQTCIWLFLLLNPIPQEVIENIEAIIFHTNEGVNIIKQWNAGVWYTRVVWISSYWFVPCIFIAPLLIRRPIILLILQTLMAIAVIISFTRGMWLALIVASIVLLLSVVIPRRGLWRWRLIGSRPAMISILAIVLAALVTNSASILAGEPTAILARINVPAGSVDLFEGESVAPLDEGTFDRVEQTRGLVAMWQEQLWFGHGYGAYIESLVRHKDRPFLYEMVPFALLMKLGIIGFGFYLGFLIVVSFRLWSLSADTGAAVALLPAFVGYLCQIHTNPVFFSFTGMFIFSILLSIWLSLEVARAAGTSNVRN